MMGLDFRSPIRIVRLEALPTGRFAVRRCEIIDDLAQCVFDFASQVNVALSDTQVLKFKTKENIDDNSVWDSRGQLSIMTSREKRDQLLAIFKPYNIPIHAIDIESEAIARALRVLGDITDPYIAILYYGHHKLTFSVFNFDQKIFFHQENIQDDSEIIIKRSFKLFNIRYPEIQINPSHCYIIGEYENPKWGIVPDITQKLDFESEEDYNTFKKTNTEWLLACGLSLWNKKSSWNLMPWRERDKRERRKILIRQLLKVILYGLGVLILAHGLILAALHFQDEHNSVLDEKIQNLNTQALSVSQAEQQINTFQAYIKILKKFPDDQLLNIKFLNNLSQSMPDGVFLNSLAVENQKAVITGRAETEAQINTLLSTLKHHSGLGNIILTNTAQDEANPPYHFDFSVSMELK